LVTDCRGAVRAACTNGSLLVDALFIACEKRHTKNQPEFNVK